MLEFLQRLRDNYVFSSNIYYNGLGEIVDKKSQKKFKAALGSYAKLAPDEFPLILFDSTLFGNAKDGFVLTTKGIHIHSGYSSEKHPPFIAYENLQVSPNEKDLIINRSKFSMVPLSVKETARIAEVINLCKDKFAESNLTPAQKTTEKSSKSFIGKLAETYPNFVVPYDEHELYDAETQKGLRSGLSLYAEFAADEIILVHYDNSLFDPSTKNLFVIILTDKGLHFFDVSYRKEPKKFFIAYRDLSVSQDEKNLIIKSPTTEIVSVSCAEKNNLYNVIGDCKKHFAGSSPAEDKPPKVPKIDKQDASSGNSIFLPYLLGVGTVGKSYGKGIKVRLYGHEFSIDEAGICEARGRYLVLESTKRVSDLVKRQVLSYRSVDEVISKIPKLAGSIYVKTIQHLLYVLKREGVADFNATKFLECVFKVTKGSAVQILCRDTLNGMSFRSDKDKIVKYTLSAINFDLGNMWRGYVFAHGYDPNVEQFSVKQFNEMNIAKKLSDKNLPIERVAELMVEILKYAPDWIEAYKVIETRLGKNPTLETYKKWFVEDFKAGSYHDISDGSMSESQAYGKMNAIIDKYKNRFVSNIYFCGADEKSDSKIKLAASHYADIQCGEIPLLCYDATVFGDASDGLLVTNKGIYAHNINSNQLYFDYSQISSIEVKGLITSSLYINNFKVDTSGENKTSRKNLCELLRLIKQTFGQKEG